MVRHNLLQFFIMSPFRLLLQKCGRVACCAIAAALFASSTLAQENALVEYEIMGLPLIDLLAIFAVLLVVALAVALVYVLVHNARICQEYAVTKTRADGLETQLQDATKRAENAEQNAENFRNSETKARKDSAVAQDRVQSLESQLQEEKNRVAEVKRQRENARQAEIAAREKVAGLEEMPNRFKVLAETVLEGTSKKLHGTLDKSLGDVSANLNKVREGLQEMSSLSSQVGDLQRVLSSARDRGQWGEVVLKDIIRQILTDDQYQENVGFDGGERVEFAIRIPMEGGISLLPVDSKFPMGDYERMVDAEKKGEDASIHRKALLNSIRNSAKDISAKYIHPPRSTDFAFLFLPTEGLYAVAAREPGFLDKIQQEQKVRITGPDSFALFLSAVRMGFQLFTAGRRANEIREILGVVKTEFGKFGEVLGKVKKNLQTATGNIDNTERRVKMMTRKLRDVEALSDEDAAKILGSDLPSVDNGKD